jgi:hypothetical protein
VKKLLVLELNELNFEFVEHYVRQGALPAFGRLIGKHGYARTRSEAVYEHIEPWIQWITVHTGKPYDEHRVFRLGDGPQAGLRQIWEELAQRGLKVGAFSPMNAQAVRDAAFFVPDPWTRTDIVAPPLMRHAYAAIREAVGDNAQGKVSGRAAVQLFLAMLRYSRLANWPRYAADAAAGTSARWRRALFLDRFMADCFLYLWQRTRPDFASLFLNGAAHIQHHCMFNSSAYRGANRNPTWYLPQAHDPVLEVFRLYDRLLADCERLPGAPRVMVATGLHQEPVDQPVFYWRLRDHAGFLERLGCRFRSVEPRMSRDFLVVCRDAEEAAATAAMLASGRAPDGTALFDVDNRGNSLFVTLSYPHDVPAGFEARFAGATLAELSREIAFVAIKNGHHNGIGYFLDTAQHAVPGSEPIPLTDLWQRMVSAF